MLHDTYTEGHTDWHSNESYQRALADNLIKSLGHDKALEVCSENSWAETLNFIKSSKADMVRH